MKSKKLISILLAMMVACTGLCCSACDILSVFSGLITITADDESGDSGNVITPGSTGSELSDLAKEYAEYNALTKEQQYEKYKSFKTTEAFLEWYDAAKAAYDKENPAIVINPGDEINIGN